MDVPLTPNTSAFLEYLSSLDPSSSANPTKQAPNTVNPSNLDPKLATSFAPPTFFNMPVPGRDTPEDTPPSSNEVSQSPEKARGVCLSDSEEGDGMNGERRSSKGNGNGHKRKAGHGHVTREEEDESEDDSASGLATGREDKRPHPASIKGPGKGGRKSTAGEEGGSKRDTTKAAKRKEQNRAAQKAFRERREAKVKDLEDKIAELEAKSLGENKENENLRSILKKLQEENVALKQSAFTFSMPMSAAGAQTSLIQQARPLTPPATEDQLRSIKDLSHAKPPATSGKGDGESPDSLASIGSSGGARSGSRSDSHDMVSPNLFDDSPNAFRQPNNAFNSVAIGGRLPKHAFGSSSPTAVPAPSQPSRSSSGISPGQVSSPNRTELDALWETWVSQGPQANAKQGAVDGGNGTSGSKAWNVNGPYSFFSTGVFNGDAKVNANFASGNGNWDKTAFRDTRGVSSTANQDSADQSMTNDPWAGMMDDSVNVFLASLTENAAPGEKEANNDEDFNAQIQRILGPTSPSAPFDLPNTGTNPFSPTNYLNISPSPVHSVAGSTPQSSDVSAYNSASPESTSSTGIVAGRRVGGREHTQGPTGSGYGTLGPAKKAEECVYVVDELGKVIKPSEIWIRMGLQHESNLEHLLIDDLCDQMKSKATTVDGQRYIPANEVQKMILYEQGEADQERQKQAGAGAVHESRPAAS